MSFEIGQVVTIYQGNTNFIVGTGNIQTISPKSSRITVLDANGKIRIFYRNLDASKYINDPGAGLYGAMLNDYIRSR